MSSFCPQTVDGFPKHPASPMGDIPSPQVFPSFSVAHLSLPGDSSVASTHLEPNGNAAVTECHKVFLDVPKELAFAAMRNLEVSNFRR